MAIKKKRKTACSAAYVHDKSLPADLPVGLRNLGNNCYQNVVVQCLVRQPGMVELFGSNADTGVLSSQMSLLAERMLSPGPTLCLTELNETTKTYSRLFSPKEQEDAHEYLVFLLTRLQMEASPETEAVFMELFLMQQVTETVCLSCGSGGMLGTDSTTAISLSIPPGDSVRLGDCMDLYCNSPVDEYFCGECQSEQDSAIKRVLFSSLSQCVIIHLKRFTSSDGVSFKDDRPVSCPVGLKFETYVAEGTVGGNKWYRLQGFICHIGAWADAGHYVAFYKVDKRWYKFNDSVVTEVPVSDLKCTDAYILFYSTGKGEPTEPEQLLHPARTPDDVAKFTNDPVSSAGLSKKRPINEAEGNAYKQAVPTKKTTLQKATDPPKATPQIERLSPPMTDMRKVGGGCNDENYVSSDDEESSLNPLNTVLYEWDGVPGAILDTAQLESYLVCELARWLYCRNIRRSSSKADLISQIRTHVSNQQSHILWSGVDGGKWLELKRDKIRRDVGEEVIEEPLLPITGWRPFPSHDVPNSFNRGQVYHYLVETHPGISRIVGKRLYVTLTSQDSRPGSEKILRRAQALVDSDYVHAVSDCKQGDRYYFVKSYIRASMELKRYFVYVVLSAASGTVLSGHCEKCVGSSLDRCSHVGALLLYMQKHVEGNGYEAVTSTGRTRTWGQGTLKRDPGRTVRSDYNKKTDEVKRLNFDPRPTAHAIDTMSEDAINTFIYELQRAEVASGVNSPQAFQNLLPIRYQDFTLPDEDEEIILEKCLQFYENLRKMARSDPFLIPGTENQGDSDNWIRFRCLLFTASISHRVLGLTSKRAKTNFLQQHLWRTNVFAGNKATRYGQKNESAARKSYLLRQQESNPTITVEETGLWIKRTYPMLGCSPDGIARSQTGPTKLVEIKCPTVLANYDPSEFDIRLTKLQQKNFPLEKIDGKIQLKKTHEHYFQVQMQMDVMRIDTCDYVVWSKHNLVIIEVPYDDEFWAPKRSELVCRHQSLLAPEYFLMRIPRGLLVLEIE